LQTKMLQYMMKSLYNRKAMKVISDKIKKVYQQLREKGYEQINIMHVCGTHEHTIVRYGIRSLLPRGVRLIAGPGCPVCIVPAREIDEAVKLALDGITVFSYGDMYRVPGTKMSLSQARSEGGNVQIVYGFRDVIIKARQLNEDAVFFAVGFETTAPTTALYIVKNKIPKNLKLLVSYRLVVPAVRYILSGDHNLHGIIAPGHVTTIIGAVKWKFVADEFKLPVVVAGFEAVDVLLAVLEILRQLLEGKSQLCNEYTRAVKWEGNVVAQRCMFTAYEEANRDWRGIGTIPRSGLLLRKEFKNLDARYVYNIHIEKSIDIKPGCKCADIILGKAVPTDCPMFLKVCTPEHPYGPCMVSSEGTCSIWAKYGGHIIFEENKDDE